MGTDISTPRLVYRGRQDVLGLGLHTDPETGELVGETREVLTDAELEQAQKDGFRLTSADPDAGGDPEGGDGSEPAPTPHGDRDHRPSRRPVPTPHAKKK
jgi:hypothetical protein